MMQKRISSGSMLGSAIIGILLFGGACGWSVFLIARGAGNRAESYFYVGVLLLFFLPMLTMCVLILNRGACIVWIDPERRLIGRRGLLWGFRLEISVADIQRVVQRYEFRDGDYFYVVDRETRCYGATRKNSYIRLRDEGDHLEFLRQIWFAPIEDQTGDTVTYR